MIRKDFLLLFLFSGFLEIIYTWKNKSKKIAYAWYGLIFLVDKDGTQLVVFAFPCPIGYVTRLALQLVSLSSSSTHLLLSVLCGSKGKKTTHMKAIGINDIITKWMHFQSWGCNCKLAIHGHLQLLILWIHFKVCSLGSLLILLCWP